MEMTPMYFLINILAPEGQSIFRYENELDATSAYHSTLASNYVAFKEGSITKFKTCLCDENLNVINMEERG